MNQLIKKPVGLFKSPHYLLVFFMIIFCREAASGNYYHKTNGVHQQQAITGKVTDEEGVSLPGVSVVINGTKLATVTNENGVYNIVVPAADAAGSLVFSYLGFISQTITIGQQKRIDVILKSDSKLLSEVVVVGYGAVAKKDLTGAVGTVNVEDLQKAPVRSFDQALAGRIAGVDVSSSDGQPGAEGVDITIRGANSLTQSNSPLYVVDGFPLEGLQTSSINPEDIESITVLKDASSTAIYGARGANGVIVIETKKGKMGAPVVSYTSSLGFNEITKTIPMMNGYDFVNYVIERSPTAGRRAYTRADLDPSDASYDPSGRTLEDYRNIPETNWQDLLFKTGTTQIHNLSLRGGTKETKYSVSGSIFNQNGVIINSAAGRYQGRLALDQMISKKLTAGVNLNYSRNTGSGQSASAGGSSGSSTAYLLYATFGYRPVTGNGILLEDELVDPEVDQSNDYRINPIVSAQNELIERRTTNIITNAYLSYKFNKALTLRIQGGLNNDNIRRDQFYNTKTSRGTPLLPNNIRGVQGSVGFGENSVWSNENTLTYNKVFRKAHTLNLVGGSSLQGITESDYGLSSQLIPNEQLAISGLDEGIPLPNRVELSSSKLASVFGRANYNYKSKYYLTATIRADGSSRFAKGNRWSYFPSAAISWRMKDESFLKDLDFITDAKLRTSYGSSGNNRVSDFAYLATLGLPIDASYAFQAGTPALGAVPSTLSNTNLRWETTNSLDIGYDLTLFNSRVELVVDWYKKVTKDLLLRANIPYTSGYSTAFKNIGKVQNTGLEVSLNTVNINAPKFKWRSNFNISFNDNKVLALNNNEEFFMSNITWDTQFNNSFLYTARVGEPASQFFGYVFDGIYQYDDFNEVTPGNYTLKSNIPGNGSTRTNIRPGDIRYKDLNGDLEVNSYDQTIIGRTLPKHTGGFNNNFSYAGFDLNVFFQWSYGRDIYNANRLFFEGGRSSNTNQFASYNDRWTPTNPSNTLNRVNGGGPNGFYSSRVIEDGSFLRLKTVSLDYSLPKRLVERLKLKDINLSVSAQNLVTWTKYTGLDPEVSVRNSTLTPGFDFSAYPRARTLVFGLNVKL